MIYDSIFEINMEQLAIDILPPEWIKPIHISWAKLIAQPYVLQLSKLKEQRTRNIYIMTHDSRVGRVQKVLNDHFDSIERRIKIGPGNIIDKLYLYTQQESKQTYLPQSVYTDQEIAERNIDFTVIIPQGLNLPELDLTRLDYMVRFYTNKDKTFKIEIV